MVNPRVCKTPVKSCAGSSPAPTTDDCNRGRDQNETQDRARQEARAKTEEGRLAQPVELLPFKQTDASSSLVPPTPSKEGYGMLAPRRSIGLLIRRARFDSEASHDFKLVVFPFILPVGYENSRLGCPSYTFRYESGAGC